MVPLATLERGELFGEQSLLALASDKNVKQPKRKTSIVVDAGEELICLTATPESLMAVGLQQWGDELSVDILRYGIAGVDAAAVDHATEAGIDVNAAICSEKKGRKDRNKGMGGVTGAVKEVARRASVTAFGSSKKGAAMAEPAASEVTA